MDTYPLSVRPAGRLGDRGHALGFQFGTGAVAIIEGGNDIPQPLLEFRQSRP